MMRDLNDALSAIWDLQQQVLRLRKEMDELKAKEARGEEVRQSIIARRKVIKLGGS